MKISINLLPYKQKSILRAKYIFRVVLEQQLLILMLLILIMLGLFAINYILKIEKDYLIAANEELIKRPEYVEILDLHKTFTQTNAHVKVISSIQKAHISWEEILHLLAMNIPTNIAISEMRSNGDVLTLRGVSQRVDSLVDFQDDLREKTIEDQNCFLDVDVPDQYLVKSEDVDFVMTLRLNVNDCMKNQYE